jgi:hypothetical protein
MTIARHLLMTLLILPALAVGQDCQVLIDRPEHVGDHATVHGVCTSEQHRSITVATTAPRFQDVTYTITIDGERRVLDVSAHAVPTRVQLTLTKAIRTETNRGTITLLPPGSVVIMASEDGQTTFTDGAGAKEPDAVLPSLRMVFHLSDGQPRNDQAFGSREPEAIGASWPIDAPEAAKALQDLALTVDPSQITGSSTLAEQPAPSGLPASPGQPAPAAPLADAGNADCLRLTTSLSFKDVTVPLAKGLEVTTSSATLVITNLLPRDVTHARVQETRLLALHLEGAGQVTQAGQSHPLTVAIDVKQRNEVTLTAGTPVVPANR